MLAMVKGRPVVVEELLTVPGKHGPLPMVGAEAVDVSTGILHQSIRDRLPAAVEVRIGIDGVWVKRYMDQAELEELS